MNTIISAVNLSNLVFRLLPGATCRLQERSRVLLTFDDGPHPSTTDLVLRKLEQHDLQALFFFTGEAVETYPQLLTSVAAGGHEIGTHGYNHHSMLKSSASEIRQQLTRSLKSTEDAVGIRPKWFRPPYGRWNPLQNDVLRELDLLLMLWNRMPCDYSPQVSLEAINKYFRRTLRGGDIVVLHENQKSPEKIDYVLDMLSSILQEKGLVTGTAPGSETDPLPI